MEEYLDVCDLKGLPTGERVARSDAHRLGIRHRTAHVWVIRRVPGSAVEILMQKRSDCKDSFPGCFDTSSAGHIKAGDDPLESALRELAEELGISAAPDELVRIGSFENQYAKSFRGILFRDNEYTNVYLYEKPVELEKLTLQGSEVSAAEWFDLKKVYGEKLAKNELFCVPIESLRLLMDYLVVR